MSEYDAVVDVSNVCRSQELPPKGAASWERLILVMGAWRDEYGPDAELYLFSDESLLPMLQGADKRRFRELWRGGGMEVVEDADPPMLELARDLNLHVISDDRFRHHRVRHRWIDKCPERFQHWKLVDGQVRFFSSGIVPIPDQEVSALNQTKELDRLHHIDPRDRRRRRLLYTRWRCTSPDCKEAKLFPEQLLRHPVAGPGGAALCPNVQCGRALTELGPRPRFREVVVADRDSGADVQRFPLEVGKSVVVGRGATADIDLDAAGEKHEQAVRRVSKRHLRLSLTSADGNDRLLAEDLGSSNGTWTQRYARRDFTPADRVAADVPFVVNENDRILIGDALLVRLSGKRYLDPLESEMPRFDGKKDRLTEMTDLSGPATTR